MKDKSKSWTSKKFNGEWARTLQKYLAKQQDIVPPGWLTSENALRKMGLKGASSGQRNKLLNQMARDGFLQKKDFRIFDGSGRRVTAIAHFKISVNL